MDLNRNVIIDLLPLYLADEASPETQTLIKEYLENDSDLAQLARQWKERLPNSPPAPVNSEAQAVAYQQAKRQIANRVITLASVIAIGGLALIAVAMLGAMFFIGL
jgi:hypothetical protein